MRNVVLACQLLVLGVGCAGGGGSSVVDGTPIAPPPAHPVLVGGTDAGPGDVAGELAAHDAGAAGDVGQIADAGDDAGDASGPPPCDPADIAAVGNRVSFCSLTSMLGGRRCAVCCTSDNCQSTLNRIRATCVFSADVVCVSADPTCSFAGCSP